jgi:16S rRNA (guanine527-N7)-methyltransferase
VIAATGLEEGLAALASRDITLPAGAAEPLMRFVGLLDKWNRTYNLTSIREPDRMITHHVLDALAVLPCLPRRDTLSLLDVGSGGGVPGIPLAIVRPAWRIVLLDSNHKKGAFLTQAVIELGLRNATAAIERVETYAPPARFDVVISRAFAELPAFVESALRHVAPRGLLVAMKGVHPHEEIEQLPSSVRVVCAQRVNVPGLDAERHLVVLEHAGE